MNVADYVLSLPRKEAKDDFDVACARGAEAVYSLIDHGLAKTQQDFN